eukprot:SAG31_NODE_1841_length_7117_cov_12.976207_2_plen_242_part_00
MVTAAPGTGGYGPPLPRPGLAAVMECPPIRPVLQHTLLLLLVITLGGSSAGTPRGRDQRSARSDPECPECSSPGVQGKSGGVGTPSLALVGRGGASGLGASPFNGVEFGACPTPSDSSAGLRRELQPRSVSISISLLKEDPRHTLMKAATRPHFFFLFFSFLFLSFLVFLEPVSPKFVRVPDRMVGNYTTTLTCVHYEAQFKSRHILAPGHREKELQPNQRQVHSTNRCPSQQLPSRCTSC